MTGRDLHNMSTKVFSCCLLAGAASVFSACDPLQRPVSRAIVRGWEPVIAGVWIHQEVSCWFPRFSTQDGRRVVGSEAQCMNFISSSLILSTLSTIIIKGLHLLSTQPQWVRPLWLPSSYLQKLFQSPLLLQESLQILMIVNSPPLGWQISSST